MTLNLHHFENTCLEIIVPHWLWSTDLSEEYSYNAQEFSDSKKSSQIWRYFELIVEKYFSFLSGIALFFFKYNFTFVNRSNLQLNLFFYFFK